MAGGQRPAAELAKAYLKHHRTKADRDFWAYEEVSERTSGKRAEVTDAWTLVLALVSAAEDHALGYVAAGPVEDFVRRFGTQVIADIETAARRDPKFRAALGMIWLSHGDLPAETLQRVVKASNDQIRPLGSRGT
jgi:hypothetical protein